MEKRELQIRADVELNLAQLNSTDDRVIETVADNLVGLGIKRRMSILPRGRLLNAAAPDLAQEQLDLISPHLNSEDSGVKCKVALALGQWGSDKEAMLIRQLLETQPDRDVQSYCIGSLGSIGGVEAAQGLAWALLNSTGVSQLGVIRKIEDLITGGSPDMTDRDARSTNPVYLVPAARSEQQLASKVIKDALGQVMRTSDFGDHAADVRRMLGY